MSCGPGTHRAGLEHESHGRCRGTAPSRWPRYRGGLASADQPGALLAHQLPGDVPVQRRAVRGRAGRARRRSRGVQGKPVRPAAVRPRPACRQCDGQLTFTCGCSRAANDPVPTYEVTDRPPRSRHSPAVAPARCSQGLRPACREGGKWFPEWNDALDPTVWGQLNQSLASCANRSIMANNGITDPRGVEEDIQSSAQSKPASRPVLVESGDLLRDLFVPSKHLFGAPNLSVSSHRRAEEFQPFIRIVLCERLAVRLQHL